MATVQEEVGLRGATTAAFAVKPDVAIALDTTLALDVPGVLPAGYDYSDRGRESPSKSSIHHSFRTSSWYGTCEPLPPEHNIPHQLEVLPRGGTDAGAMQRARHGAAAITLSIPSRYVHTVNEMVSSADLDAAITLAGPVPGRSSYRRLRALTH